MVVQLKCEQVWILGMYERPINGGQVGDENKNNKIWPVIMKF